MSAKWFVVSPAPVEKGRRTLVWRVTTVDGGHLGFIEWYSPWRCYAFYPAAETLFEKTCLRDLADFCEQATVDHMAKVRASRQVGQVPAGRSHP